MPKNSGTGAGRVGELILQEQERGRSLVVAEFLDELVQLLLGGRTTSVDRQPLLDERRADSGQGDTETAVATEWTAPGAPRQRESVGPHHDRRAINVQLARVTRGQQRTLTVGRTPGQPRYRLVSTQFPS